MTPDFKAYLKYALTEFLLSFIFPLILYFIVEDSLFILIVVIFNVLGFFAGYYRYKDGLLFQKKLKVRGLTGEDLNNIEFVKSWDEIRSRGPIKYSLLDGGVFFGFALGIGISILLFVVKPALFHYISLDPSNMFRFIGYTYLAGSMIGIVIYRNLWTRNENKFIRLTDPLH